MCPPHSADPGTARRLVDANRHPHFFLRQAQFLTPCAHALTATLKLSQDLAALTTDQAFEYFGRLLFLLSTSASTFTLSVLTELRNMGHVGFRVLGLVMTCEKIYIECNSCTKMDPRPR